MGAQTEISWCDSTHNGWIGCTAISPACDHCYAKAMMDERLHRVTWGAGQQRVRTSASNWYAPIRWNRTPFGECNACGWRGEIKGADPALSGTPVAALLACPACEASRMSRARRRVFCHSLADVFDNEVPIEWLVDLFDLVRSTPNLDWLLLTKRIGNVASRTEAAIHWIESRSDWSEDGPRHSLENLRNWLADWMLLHRAPTNVWLGATICNQAEAERDIPKLLATPARLRFLSIEPLLGPISFEGMWVPHANPAMHENMLERLDWVIVGGESGPHARPMHPAWVRTLRDQCAAVEIPFFFKQWGEWAPQVGAVDGWALDDNPELSRFDHRDWNEDHWGEPYRPMWCDDRDDDTVSRIGKKRAGRVLDGQTHNAFPKSAV